MITLNLDDIKNKVLSEKQELFEQRKQALPEFIQKQTRLVLHNCEIIDIMH